MTEHTTPAEKAEARKVITAWLARTESSRPLPDHADDLLATLAAEGLLVGPGEPATSEAMHVGLLDKDGLLWQREGVDLWRTPSSVKGATFDDLERDRKPLTALYAHPPVTADAGCTCHIRDAGCAAHEATPPVTAEPATAPSVDNLIAKYAAIAEAICDNGTAGDHTWSGLLADFFRAIPVDTSPSVEQIAEVLRNSASGIREDALDQVADYIHVLYSHREGAADIDIQVRRLTSALAASQHNYANMRDGRLNDTQVENEKLRAALEAADQHIGALNLRAKHVDDASRAEHNRAFAVEYAESTGADYAAARAAIEANTTEEA